jgi:3-phenylpropionate/trans-cinnamate dioxygenase ferredoxin subunit
MANFVRVGRLADIQEGGAIRVEVDGEAVALFRVAGRIYAIADTCTHEEASLSEGFLEGETVECPLHGARFDLKTGKPVTLPATRPTPVYEVKVERDEIFIRCDPQKGPR